MKVLTRLMLAGLFTCSIMVLGGCEAKGTVKPIDTPATTPDEDHDHDEGDGDHDHDEDGTDDKK